jgi:hypothetical protein
MGDGVRRSLKLNLKQNQNQNKKSVFVYDLYFLLKAELLKKNFSLQK